MTTSATSDPVPSLVPVKQLIAAFLDLAGLAMIAAGIAAINRPAGVIAAGAALLLAAYRIDT
jgi:hypothetical protein